MVKVIHPTIAALVNIIPPLVGFVLMCLLYAVSVSYTHQMCIRDRIRIVEDLQQAGIFYMKGAVSEVAAQLGSSEATIYRYLSKLKD